MSSVQNQVAELFGVTRVPYGDNGQFVRGVSVTCGHCGAVENVPANNLRNGAGDDVEVQLLKRKLETRGWKTGSKPAQHRCPKCFSSIKATAARRASENSAAATNGETPVSVTPIKSLKDVAARMLGREDRRIIFEKLNEVYVNDKVGYGAGWTDEKVANDLGVPRAWVKLIRDENFGDEVANEEIRQKLAEASKLLDEVKKTTAQAEAIVTDLKRLNHEAEHIGKALDTIRKALGGG
ncbi:hypothetical protein ABID65_007720 [Bradyrhizobium sp. S3.9.2]|nr:hypothetical protein [Bradyrhizobium japonicum]